MVGLFGKNDDNDIGEIRPVSVGSSDTVARVSPDRIKRQGLDGNF